MAGATERNNDGEPMKQDNTFFELHFKDCIVIIPNGIVEGYKQACENEGHKLISQRKITLHPKEELKAAKSHLLEKLYSRFGKEFVEKYVDICIYPFTDSFMEKHMNNRIASYWYISLKKNKKELKKRDLLYLFEMGYKEGTFLPDFDNPLYNFGLNGNQKLIITTDKSARKIFIEFLKEQPAGKYDQWVEKQICNEDLLKKSVGKFVFITEKQRFGWMFELNMIRTVGGCGRERVIGFFIDAETGDVYEHCTEIGSECYPSTNYSPSCFPMLQRSMMDWALGVSNDPKIYFQKSNG